jgi:hypothetical protein
MKEEVQKEETTRLKGPEEEGTLASLLEESPHPVFTGHPAMGDAYEEPPEEEEETPPEETKEASEEKPEPPGKKPEEPPKFKYKSHEEAEAGALEHQRFATEKAEEAKRLREELEALRAEKPPEEPRPPEKSPAEVEAEREAKVEQALEEISELDEFDSEYRKKVARAWLKAGFGGAGQEPLPADKLVEQIWGKVEAKLNERDQQRQRKEEEVTVWQQAVELAKGHGLDMTAGSADYRLFSSLAPEAPEAEFEDQVKWASEKVKEMVPRHNGMTAEERRQAEAAQQRNAPLERGGTPPPKPSSQDKDKGFSLNQIIEDSKQSQII